MAHRPQRPAGEPRRPDGDARLVVPEELEGAPLDAALRLLANLSWSGARRLIRTGKVRVGEEVTVEARRPVAAGEIVLVSMRAPRPRAAGLDDRDLLVHVDAHLVVVRKPPGISTVPFGGEREVTLDAVVREALGRRARVRGRAPLGVVQRLDRPTSGLLVFARTLAAKRGLATQLRRHTMHRVYLALAHGDVPRITARSELVEDRGDGVRGTRRPGDPQRGRLAITHVEPVLRLAGATLVRCRLETGRTHQIRIHLAEAGHPLLGEQVYVRGKTQLDPIPASRLMLHAAELGFSHPATGAPLRFEEPPPEDFLAVLERLRLPP